MLKKGQEESNRIMKEIYLRASMQPKGLKNQYSAQFIGNLKQANLPIHPSFVIDRVGKYRNKAGQSVIHVAVDCALAENDVTMLEELLKIKLYMYEADGYGRTCLFSTLDVSASMKAAKNVMETVIKKHGFDITKICFSAQGKAGNSLLKGLFWKLFELGDST